MAIEIIQRSGFLGLKKTTEKVTQNQKFSLIKPFEEMKFANILKENEVSTCSEGNNLQDKGFKIRYFADEWINKGKLIVWKNGKPARLRWKEK